MSLCVRWARVGLLCGFDWHALKLDGLFPCLLKASCILIRISAGPGQSRRFFLFVPWSRLSGQDRLEMSHQVLCLECLTECFFLKVYDRVCESFRCSRVIRGVRACSQYIFDNYQYFSRIHAPFSFRGARSSSCSNFMDIYFRR